MPLTEDEKYGLGIALNEATLLGLEVSDQDLFGTVTVAVLTLPKQGVAPKDSRVQLLFGRIGRIAASLRLGNWNDRSAQVVPLELEQLLPVVQEFGGLPVYGWEFFDLPMKDFEQWADRLSLDRVWELGGLSHSITLFQEGHHKHLDVRLWFDLFMIRSVEEIPLQEFIDGGKRWWDALYAKDA